MLLQELIGLKALSTDTLMAALSRLESAGRLNVHNGDFAFVLVPTNADHAYRVWIDDLGWLEYLSFVYDHPGNKHLLRTFGRIKSFPFTFRRPVDFDATLHALRVERLYPLSRDQTSLVDALGGYLRGYAKREASTDPDAVNAYLADRTGVDTPLEASFIRTAVELVDGAGAVFTDLRSDNVMRRQDGTLVFTDPYYYDDKQVTVTAADLLHGRFHGKYRTGTTKTGR